MPKRKTIRLTDEEEELAHDCPGIWVWGHSLPPSIPGEDCFHWLTCTVGNPECEKEAVTMLQVCDSTVLLCSDHLEKLNALIEKVKRFYDNKVEVM